MSMDFINYGPIIKKQKRWYPEHSKPGGSRKGEQHSAVLTSDKISAQDAYDVCLVRKECELSCVGCKYYKTDWCKHLKH